jgi:hypothetical protein
MLDQYKLKSRLNAKETVSYCQGLFSSETWENMYLHDDIKSIFNDFLKTFLNIVEASFLVT